MLLEALHEPRNLISPGEDLNLVPTKNSASEIYGAGDYLATGAKGNAGLVKLLALIKSAC